MTFHCNPYFFTNFHPLQFTGSQHDALTAISVTFSLISFFGVLLIIVSYLTFAKLRTFSFGLVFFMSCADLGALFSYLLGSPGEGGLCRFQGLLQQYCELSSIIWSALIAFTLYRAVVKLQDSASLLKRYLAFGYGIPVICAFLPLFTSSYTNTGGWCWISNTQTVGQVWRWLLFYGPLWSCVGYNAYCYYLTEKAMKNMFSNQGTEMPTKYKALIKRLKLYPLILVVCWTWATINRLQNAFSPDNPVFWLYVLQSLFRSLQGLLNCVAYGLQPNVRKCWVEWLSNRPRTGWLVDKLRVDDDVEDDKEEGEEIDGETLCAFFSYSLF